MRVTLLLVLAACRVGTSEGSLRVDEDDDGAIALFDCDDTDPAVFPGAPERCNGVDDDCDGDVDDAPTDGTPFFADRDGDGFGDPYAGTSLCAAVAGWVADDTDCDDRAPDTHPGATETTCDDVDRDCDGAPAFADSDGDGFRSCEDCDDADPGAHPGAIEVCNGVDDDCDDDVDEAGALGGLTWYADTDEDGHGDPATAVIACAAPEGHVADRADCDDEDEDVHPGAPEVCDDVDQDCDGDIDEQATDLHTFYADVDGDGFAGTAVTVRGCTPPPGFATAADDCDDLDAGRYPGAPERCNGRIDDCAATTLPADEADADTDGWRVCAGDCNDGRRDVSPGAVEVCDGRDNDCDTATDEAGALGAVRWYLDDDDDLFGDPASWQLACAAPADHVADATDCDDDATDVHPGATEVCNGTDDDCDGAVDDSASDVRTWYADLDGDGRGGAAVTARACEAPAGMLATREDCDDLARDTYPGAPERCDGVQNDCDATAFPADEVDDDADGWLVCANDCDDDNGDVHPGAVELCNGDDDDCDGTADDDAADRRTWYVDLDGDGHAGSAGVRVACDQPSGTFATATDCDDLDRTVFPGAPELCDGVKNDCATASLPADEADGDRDGWRICAGDCDDQAPAAHPGAAPRCDDADNDCDGAVDFDHDGDDWSDAICGGSDCDDHDATSAPGTARGCVHGRSCDEAYDAGFVDSGVYRIDPDGPGPGAPFDATCDQDFLGGGWLLVWNLPKPPTTTAGATQMHNALISRSTMTAPVTATTTSTSIATSGLPMAAYTEVIYGWVPAGLPSPTRYGRYVASNLVGAAYVDGYPGAYVAMGNLTAYPTGQTKAYTTGSDPSYPHVGMGFSGQVIVWGYDKDASANGSWGNWYDLNACCNAGNTAEAAQAGWRYVIYIR